MKRYGRRPSAADELRKKNALKLYEPHLSAETRRQLEGHKGPKIEQAEQAATRVADKMPEFTPEEAARDLGVLIGWDMAGSGGDHSVIAVRTEDGISCHTINTDRIAADSILTRCRAPWREIEQITPNDGDTVLLWWPPHGPCLGTYFTSYLKPWRVVSWDGKTFKASFVELCADGAVFQPIDPTS